MMKRHLTTTFLVWPISYWNLTFLFMWTGLKIFVSKVKTHLFHTGTRILLQESHVGSKPLQTNQSLTCSLGSTEPFCWKWKGELKGLKEGLLTFVCNEFCAWGDKQIADNVPRKLDGCLNSQKKTKQKRSSFSNNADVKSKVLNKWRCNQT